MSRDEMPFTTVEIDYDLIALARRGASGNDLQLKHSEFVNRIDGLRSHQGRGAAADALRQSLRTLLDEGGGRIDSLNYPQVVRSLIHDEFDRLREQLAGSDNGYFDPASFRLRCDLRTACFSRVPVGSNTIEISGVPRSIALRGGCRQAMRFLRMLWRTKGTAPFYQTHMAAGINQMNFMHRSGPKERERTFRNIAECLRRNPAVLGAYGSSWLYDPRLAEVSPHLSFFGKVLVENGGFLFRYRESSGSKDKALRKSRARRQSFEKGAYTPTSYTAVWPRTALIDWADRTGTDA